MESEEGDSGEKEEKWAPGNFGEWTRRGKMDGNQELTEKVNTWMIIELDESG